jgi:hypothetical protein
MTASAVLERIDERSWISPVSLEAAAIHKEGWRASHAAARAGRDIALNAFARSRPGQIVGDGNRIDTTGRRILDQIIVLQCILVLEQQVMHPPERIGAAARRDRFGRLGRRPRVRVHLGYGKIPEDESHVIANLFKDLLKDDMGKAALRTLVIAILNKSDRRVGGTKDVVVCTNWANEYGRHASPACVECRTNGRVTG